ncbi:FliH/SctL family protein [Marinomonas epiphytica]
MSDPQDNKAKKLTAYERWELPHLDNPQKANPTGPAILHKKEDDAPFEEVDQDSLVYEPLTASQLEEIRSAAYDEGFVQGESEGHDKGYADGFSKGEVNGFEKGYEDGQSIGAEEGRAEAQQKAEQQFAQVETLLSALFQEVQRPLEESRAGAEQILNAALLRMVESVCLTQVKEELKDSLKAQLSRIFDEIGEFEGRVKVRLHPDDMSVLDELAISDRLALKLVEDPDLTAGGFVIDSQSFYVDGRVEQRIAAVCDELRNLFGSHK